MTLTDILALFGRDVQQSIKHSCKACVEIRERRKRHREPPASLIHRRQYFKVAFQNDLKLIFWGVILDDSQI